MASIRESVMQKPKFDIHPDMHGTVTVVPPDTL